MAPPATARKVVAAAKPSVAEKRRTAHAHIRALDHALKDYWQLGRNQIVGWAPRPDGIEILVMPQWMLPKIVEVNASLLVGRHVVRLETLRQNAAEIGLRTKFLRLPFTLGQDGISPNVIDSVVRRYSVTRYDHRAALLFDIVGFGLYSALEQVTVINSLAYSINVAHRRMLDADLRVDLGRSTTGDGFYVWNRETGITGDLNLLYLMGLILADNALARRQGGQNTVPILRTCFHVGSHYEFFQSDGLNPVVSGYIVGDLTVEMARLIDKALPEQVLIGSFLRPSTELAEDADDQVAVSTPAFVTRAQEQVNWMRKIQLSSHAIETVRAYLTGDRLSTGVFNIKKYAVVDKHNLRHEAFNAKFNIHLAGGDSLHLGLENSEMARFKAEQIDYVPGKNG